MTAHSHLPGKSRIRQIKTPEGILLPIELATRGERATAFVIDIMIQVAAVIGVTALLLLMIGPSVGTKWASPFMFLAWFLIRTFYFAFFEIRWLGSTPGKRVMGVRVIDRMGGPLTPNAIFTRNFMREVEIFLPLSLVGTQPFGVADAWASLLALIWALIFLFMPFFNRDAMRVGDLVGGTWVVHMPKAQLLADLTKTARVRTPDIVERDTSYEFTAAQLSIYGISELQVLEGVLRHDGASSENVQRQVADRIRTKVNWSQPDGAPYSDREFLEAFYKALRLHLERGVLFGKRKKDKHDVD